jgi:hypothetical protein
MSSTPGFTPISASYTVPTGNARLVVTTGGSTILITLPPVGSSDFVSARKVDAATGSMRVATADGSTINTVPGATGITSASQHGGWTLENDGANWWVTGT